MRAKAEVTRSPHVDHPKHLPYVCETDALAPSTPFPCDSCFPAGNSSPRLSPVRPPAATRRPVYPVMVYCLFREHFFEICPKLLYLDPATASPDMIEKQEVENENDLARFGGESLKFGSVVQLRHLLTGKFLSVEKQRSGKIVVLSAGSEMSHLRVWPALSSEQVGNLVRVNHLVQLLSISFDEGNVHATRLDTARRVQVSNQPTHASFSIEAVHLH